MWQESCRLNLLDGMCNQVTVLLRLARMERLAVERPVPLSGSGYTLLAIARLVSAKGFDIQLDAMSEIVKSLPMTELWVLGEGDLQCELQLQAERLGSQEKVHFEGFQSNPFGWMRHADVVIQSSRSEGLPNVLIEAAGLGTPVIALDCLGGTAEVLHADGVGILVKAARQNSLKRQLTSLAARQACYRLENVREQ